MINFALIKTIGIMTRINYGISPSKLTDQHLLAEFRELPRIPRKVKKCIINNEKVNVYDGDFCLGAGHVRFFYNKLAYLHNRYNCIYYELKKRRFIKEYDTELFHMPTKELDDIFIIHYYNDTGKIHFKDIAIVENRIATRIRESKQIPRYYRKPIDKEYYIKNILEYEN